MTTDLVYYLAETISEAIIEAKDKMSMRDKFASAIIMGLIAMPTTSTFSKSTENLVEKAYEIADAMMKERNKF